MSSKACKTCPYAAVCLGEGVYAVRDILTKQLLTIEREEKYGSYGACWNAVVVMVDKKFPRDCPKQPVLYGKH